MNFSKPDFFRCLLVPLAVVLLLGVARIGSAATPLVIDGRDVANLASGVPYLFAKWLGYNEPDMAGHVVDYGTKFLVCAGLMNILAMVDAFEIATGKKD